VYILDSGDRKIVEVDLKSGDGRLLTQYGNHTAQLFQSPRDIIFDEQNQRLLILDRGDAVISSLNLVTGQTEVIASATVGNGVSFELPEVMAFDEVSGRLFVVDGALRAVISVSVKTGERKVIRQQDLGDDDVLFSPSRAIDYDPQTDRVLIYSSVNDGGVFAIDPITGSGNYTANAEDSVFIGIDGSSVLDKSSQRLLLTTSRGLAAIDLANGMTELLSSRSIGAGVEYGSLRGIALDQNNNRVILTDIILDALIEVDLETGDRRIIADANTGSGVDLSAPLNLRLDLKNNIAYVVDSILGGIIAVNLATGDRIILAD
jgi:DNA-binding beta-propeller fold protein YncE